MPRNPSSIASERPTGPAPTTRTCVASASLIAVPSEAPGIPPKFDLDQCGSDGPGSRKDGRFILAIPFRYRCRMKLNQMRDVVAIAERGSLRAAARHLSLAQPALTRSVHELERELGVPLFERRARGMILTPMGEAFVRRANAVLSEVRRARDEVEQLHGGTRG